MNIKMKFAIILNILVTLCACQDAPAGFIDSRLTVENWGEENIYLSEVSYRDNSGVQHILLPPPPGVTVVAPGETMNFDAPLGAIESWGIGISGSELSGKHDGYTTSGEFKYGEIVEVPKLEDALGADDLIFELDLDSWNSTFPSVGTMLSAVNGYIPTYDGLFLGTSVDGEGNVTDGFTGTAQFLGSDLIKISTIPEPSTLALIGLAGGITMFIRRLHI